MIKFRFKTKDGKRRVYVNFRNEIEVAFLKPMDLPTGLLFYMGYPYPSTEK